MYKLCIFGEVKSLKKEINQEYEEFWRPSLLLIRNGILTYTEAMTLNADELYRLSYAFSLYQKEEEREVERING